MDVFRQEALPSRPRAASPPPPPAPPASPGAAPRPPGEPEAEEAEEPAPADPLGGVVVEVCLRRSCAAEPQRVREAVLRVLRARTLCIPADTDSVVLSGAGELGAELARDVESVSVCVGWVDDDDDDDDDDGSATAAVAAVAAGPVVLPAGGALLGERTPVCVYRLPSVDEVSGGGGAPELLLLSEEEDAGEGAGTVACQQWELPARVFCGLWESLLFDGGLKGRLLRYMRSAMLFSRCGVDPTVVSFNRVVFLHGPPGTGKTSLCRALAQKLAIRLSDAFQSAVLVEVNAHSLFSKWFSESGKLVHRMFEQIRALAEERDNFVVVLVDEVESVAAARHRAVGTEPSDAIRVVNALLTQIDRLKTFSNVLVLATSNVTSAVDPAFIDRADIKQFVGLPGLRARYAILRSCLAELVRAKLVGGSAHFLDFRSLAHVSRDAGGVIRCSHELLAVAEKADGMSGRALRKLPFLAHAQLAPPAGADAAPFDQRVFLRALDRAVVKDGADRARLAC